MEPQPTDSNLRPERFRPYLRLLAEMELGPELRTRIDPSDVVQETLLRAHRGWGEFRGVNEESLTAWLRQILSNALSSLRRDHYRERRDIRRERPLGRTIDDSSSRVIELAGRFSSPSHRLNQAELSLRLSTAIVDLPDDQRQVFLLRHFEDWSLPKIAEILGRTRPSVAGLLRRAVEQVRGALPAQDEN
ncbi:MAG: sigma-70 family RNA polymerase sigma factor [Planctomycetota bacterium]